ncbi:16351_t:CDS:2 [Cetraspora pellucida]|uniref:16351_t:CDS:1 n=1 Tax=Cetraspora pellucida TaxID=1433469 RepID=A0A9N9GMD4_9GLOM|nr:16351_t:CDS:2 [Cetraspora pellucida]
METKRVENSMLYLVKAKYSPYLRKVLTDNTDSKQSWDNLELGPGALTSSECFKDQPFIRIVYSLKDKFMASLRKLLRTLRNKNRQNVCRDLLAPDISLALFTIQHAD